MTHSINTKINHAIWTAENMKEGILNARKAVAGVKGLEDMHKDIERKIVHIKKAIKFLEFALEINDSVDGKEVNLRDASRELFNTQMDSLDRQISEIIRALYV